MVFKTPDGRQRIPTITILKLVEKPYKAAEPFLIPGERKTQSLKYPNLHRSPTSILGSAITIDNTLQNYKLTKDIKE